MWPNSKTGRTMDIEALRGPRVKTPTGYLAERSRSMREKFLGAPLQSGGAYNSGLLWSPTYTAIGRGAGLGYTSDKWREKSDFQDYKHIAEGPQVIWASRAVTSGSSIERNLDGEPWAFEPPDWVLPEVGAELAPALFVEVELYGTPTHRDEGYRRILLPQAMLFGGYARRPGSDPDSRRASDYRCFLAVGCKAGGLAILITGSKLSVGRNGVEGLAISARISLTWPSSAVEWPDHGAKEGSRARGASGAALDGRRGQGAPGLLG